MKSYLYIIILIFLFPIAIFSQDNYRDYSEKQKTIIFSEDFSNNLNDWWTGNNASAYASIENGNYILEWRGSVPIWNSYKEIKFDLSRDFEIEANIRQLSGSPDFLFGLVFNKSENGEYAFVVNLHNASLIYQDKANEERRFIKSGIDSSIEIKVEVTKYNKFTIRKIKNEFFFFINEQFVGSGFAEDLSSTLTGFQLWYKVKISVDNLVVSYLNSMNYPPEISITSPDISNDKVIIVGKTQINIKGKVFDESGIPEVLINNQKTFVDANGNFTLKVNLVIGENTFTIKATNSNNLFIIKTFTINCISNK